MIKVLIVEDQKMIRGLLEKYVNERKGYELTASIDNAVLAKDVCQNACVDVVLMDVMTKDGNSGLDATREIKKEMPHIKIVVVTSLMDSAVLDNAQAYGADGLWYKDVSDEELMSVVDRVAGGEKIFPDHAPVVDIGMAKSCEFTKKEIEVLRYLIKGMSYPKIAKEMGVDVPAIKWHVSNMLQKTGFDNKLKLALAVQAGKLIADEI